MWNWICKEKTQLQITSVVFIICAHTLSSNFAELIETYIFKSDSAMR